MPKFQKTTLQLRHGYDEDAMFISTTSSADNEVTSTTSSSGSVLGDDDDAMLIVLEIRKVWTILLYVDFCDVAVSKKSVPGK